MAGKTHPLPMDIHPSDYDLAKITWKLIIEKICPSNSEELLDKAMKYDDDNYKLHSMISGHTSGRNFVELMIGEDMLKKLEAVVSDLIPTLDTKRRKIEKNLVAPSDFAKNHFTDPNVDDHRSNISHSLHISVQMKLFGDFIDKLNESFVEERYYLAASELMHCMSDYLPNETTRQRFFCESSRKLLGWNIDHFEHKHGRSDSTILVADLRNSTAIVNLEFKNEFTGISCCPVKQNIGYFENFKADEMSRSPMLLCSIVGPYYMQVFGAVWNGSKVCVDPLTAPVSLLYVRRDPIHGVRSVAKVLQAIDNTIPKLAEYYCSKNKSKFGWKGPYYKTDEFKYMENNFEQAWMFKASPLYTASAKEYVIKFVRSNYGSKPHEVLADKNFAPKLYDCDKLSGGWIAVVMEFVKGRMLELKDKQNRKVQSQLQNAVKLLHDSGYVHGDLRCQNVIVRDNDSICIVDFDWAGSLGSARYPVELCKVSPGQWHDGVKCGGLIRPEHDLFQIGQ